MRISIEDYESRALDYVEGNLPADELPAFEAFLSEHPDLGRCWPGVFRPGSRKSSGGRKVLQPWSRKSPLRLT